MNETLDGNKRGDTKIIETMATRAAIKAKGGPRNYWVFFFLDRQSKYWSLNKEANQTFESLSGKKSVAQLKDTCFCRDVL